MKRALLIVVALALPGVAFAKIDPTRPMLTAHGNVVTHPGRVIIANQVASESGDDVVKLDKFVVTGSLIHPKKHSASKARR